MENKCAAYSICRHAGDISSCEYIKTFCQQFSEERREEVRPDTAPKNDEDNYIKVDLSLVPFEILSRDYYEEGMDDLVGLQHLIHNKLNGDDFFPVAYILNRSLFLINVNALAGALGYGCSKYYRDSWREGFGGDYKRFLRAAMRHLHAYLIGEEYDGEAIEGYPKGLNHLGAVLFSLMVADVEAR